ncbi:MAG: methyltransferase domain-containing protein [Candidatus Diapherotrites archaeon]|nr:methyltransferase domain-containing protein [Candidatus Diapherotrites archaeon]
MKKLHLCCGFDYKQGFVNVDNISGGPQDMTADLNKKWAFTENNSVDYIFIKDGLEHMDSLNHFFEECSRVLSYGGKVEIWVPHYKAPCAYRITHKFFFSWSMFDCFPEPHDVIQDLKVVSNKLVVEPKVFPFTLINPIANIFPKYWERMFYVAGLKVILEKQTVPKNKK